MSKLDKRTMNKGKTMIAETTRTAIRAIVDADLTATKEERDAIKMALNGGDARALPRVIRRKEAMALTGLSRASVANLAAAGIFKRVVRPNGQRGIGYTEESVRAYIEGRATA